MMPRGLALENCPSTQLLERLLQDDLNDPELTVVLTHVEDCARCQQVLHELALNAPGPTPLGLLTALSETALGGPAAEAEAFLLSVRANPQEQALTPAIDGYEILEEIGRGAAGTVYRARHRELDRPVALKIIVAGPHLSSEARARFRREALALARLQHQNIVQIYDVGEHAGYPYLTLELIEGTTLARWLGGLPRPAREAARITATLAEAVQYAHQQGVIHRDLKPANILLRLDQPSAASRGTAAGDSAGEPWLKIADFGLAKLLSTSVIAEDPMTQSGAAVGTPAYVAPEQARGDSAEVGPTADVYSIGVILYELLTGRPPFQGPTPMETLVQAAHQEPVAPSRLAPQVPRDLQTICLKCLEKKPANRYRSAADLAADLSRFLQDKPIQARPVGWFERWLRWMRRNRSLSTALGGVVVSLCLLAIGAITAAAHFSRLEQEQRALALEKGRLFVEKEAERNKALLSARREIKLRKSAEWQREKLRHNLYFARMNLVGQAATSPSGIGRISEFLAPWEPAIWQQGPADLRQWEWYYLNGLCHRDRFTLRGHENGVLAVAWSPDSQCLVSGGRDGTLRLWSAATGLPLNSVPGHSRTVNTVAWSPDGALLASGSIDGTIKLWDATTLQELRVLAANSAEVWSVAWSPDGRRLAAGGSEHVIRIWDTASGAHLLTLRGHVAPVASVAWSPDGEQLASGGHDHSVRLWDTISGEPKRVLSGHGNWVNNVAWNADGSRLASASNDETIKIWDSQSGKEISTLYGHNQSVLAVAWSPDGSRLATSSEDQTVKVWSASGGPELFSLRGHTDRAGAVAWSLDGRQLASAADDATIKLWDADTGPETAVLRGHDGEIDSLVWTSDSGRLASASADGGVYLWNVADNNRQTVLRGHDSWVRSVAWDPASRRLASAGSDHTIRIWDADSGAELQVLTGHQGEVFSVAWSPDARRLASAGADHTIRFWDSASGKETQVLRGHQQWVRSVAWSPDGARLASSSWDRTLKVWDTTTHLEMLSLVGHTGEVTCVTWSPDAKQLASTSADQTIIVWDATTGKAASTLRGHTARVNAVVWSPDGTQLASASSDKSVKVWDVATGEETLTLTGHRSQVDAVAWSPDGLILASAGADRVILLHDATAGYLAARSAKYLPVLDRRLAANPDRAADWRLRAEINALRDDWTGAASDAQNYLDRCEDQQWFELGRWVAGPYPARGSTVAPRTNASDGSQSTSDPATAPIVGDLPLRSTLTDPAGFVNLGGLFGHANHVAGYVVLRVFSPRTQPVAILIGSDDYVRLWLDGALIHEMLHPRAAKPDEDAIGATLKAGWNTLIARVDNLTGEHGLYLRLSDDPADIGRAR